MKAGKAICFDTAPLIWGVREDANRGDEHFIGRTQRYIKWLREQGAIIMVPAPVLAEYFVGASATELRNMEVLRRGFLTPPLNTRAAILAAELQRGSRIQTAIEMTGSGRQCLKTDALIIAIAICNDAEFIVTNNVSEFESLADGRIEIHEVPLIDEQLQFDYPDGV